MRILSANATRTLVAWIDSHSDRAVPETTPEERRSALKFRFARAVPFIVLHLACLTVFWTGWSWAALSFALAAYLVRMHAITGWYHRYFSHRTFRTSRPWQFIWAAIGNSTYQRGPLWWAAHHRHHHRHSDEEEDTHSPKRLGFWYSHSGWFFARKNYRTRLELVPDLARYPELMWLDRFDFAVPTLSLALVWCLGFAAARWLPMLHTGPWQLLSWYVVSTIVVAHATFTINSCAHLVGSRRYQTSDTSRNHLGLALLTLGEGWHNNHHYYQSSARQGFFWWEIDVSYYLLVLQRSVGLVQDLKGVPDRARRPQPVPAAGPSTAPGSPAAGRMRPAGLTPLSTPALSEPEPAI